MKTDMVPVKIPNTPEEARLAAIRAAEARKRLFAAGEAAQLEFNREAMERRQAAIRRVCEMTERYEAEKRQRDSMSWESAVDEAMKRAALSHPLPLVPLESVDTGGAILPGKRIAAKADVIRHLRKMAARYGVTFEIVCGMSRRRNIVTVRHWMIRFCSRVRPDWPLTALGRMFRRDHSTIIHALKQRGRPSRITKQDIREAEKANADIRQAENRNRR